MIPPPEHRIVAGRSPAAGAWVSLVVKVPPTGTKRTLRHDLARSVGTSWTVARLFEPSAAHPDLMRWFVVSGPVVGPGPLTDVQAAWEAAHRLQATGPYEIEPQVPKSVEPPELDPVAAGLGEAPHLPASANKRWGHTMTRAARARMLKPTSGGMKHGAGVVIGHPDTGFTRHRGIFPAALDLDLDHDILDADDNAEDPMESGNTGHGTHTGYVIAGRDFGGLLGIAPGATLRPIRTITSVLVLFGGNVARAIDYARRTGCDVISMSLGGLFLGGVRDAVDAAVADGCIVLAAAGNIWPWVVEPANYPSCIAVAAINADGRKWSGSASGTAVAISAPGESVWTATWAGGNAASFRSNGTSYAVAHVAGVAALWLSHHGPGAIRARYGGQTSAAFRQLLAETARKPTGWPSRGMGPGIVDARALLRAPLPDTVGLGAGVAAVAGEPPPSAEMVLKELAPPRTMTALRGAVEASTGAAAGEPGEAVTAEQTDLLFRELVYLSTEQPAMSSSLGVPTAQARRLMPDLMRSLGSPTLARRFHLSRGAHR